MQLMQINLRWEPAITRAIMAACGFLLAWTPAHALPAYAKKEGKACAYCHINPAGGGPRNYRGIYYGGHNHSFQGFVDNGGVTAPVLKMLWSEVLPKETTRAAVVTPAGPGKPLLVAVTAPDSAHRLVALNSWDETAKKLTQVATAPSTPAADRMEAGQFGADKSPEMVLPTGYFSIQPGSLTFHPGAGAANLAGAVRLKDGSETFVLWNGKSSVWHSVNTAAGAPSWLGEGPRFPADTRPTYVWAEGRGPATPQIARLLKAPADPATLTLFGAWDPEANGRWYFYLPQHTPAGEVVALLPAGLTDPAWKSQPLAGRVLDAFVAPDLRGSKASGLYALADGAAGAPGRTLYFFALTPAS